MGLIKNVQDIEMLFHKRPFFKKEPNNLLGTPTLQLASCLDWKLKTWCDGLDEFKWRSQPLDSIAHDIRVRHSFLNSFIFLFLGGGSIIHGVSSPWSFIKKSKPNDCVNSAFSYLFWISRFLLGRNENIMTGD